MSETPRGEGTEYDPGPVPEPDFDAEERPEEDQ